MNQRPSYIIAVVSDALDVLRSRDCCDPVQRIIQGKAGTGKSTVIGLLTAITKLKFYDFHHPVLRAALTGIAAFYIKGQTIHDLFRINKNNHSPQYIEALSDSNKQKLRTEFKDIQLLFIDGVSMVGARMMNQIDEALKFARGCQSPSGWSFLCLFRGL